MIRSDMPEVLRIEQLCFDHPWSKDDFIAVLRQRNAIGIVAENRRGIAGYVIYELHEHRIVLMNLAVDPQRQRTGVGTAIVDRIKEKLHQQRRREIVAAVRESNLDAHLFFRACGFRALSVLRAYYDDEDAYSFAWRLPQEAPEMEMIQ